MATPLVRALFGRLFDNAAMYPPAQAPMEASLALHDVAERAPWGFARGRFLCPGARLTDLADELAMLGLDRKAVRVGAVVGSPADTNARAGLDQVVAAIDLLRSTAPGVHVDLLEVRPVRQDPDGLRAEVGEVVATATGQVDNLFVEVAVAGQDTGLVRDRLAALAEAGAGAPIRLGAKVRCGGLEPGMVPTVDQLGAFLVAARTNDLPFKATAGLHHALSAADGSHHGFLSLLLASVLGRRHDLDLAATVGLLGVTADELDAGDDVISVRQPGQDELTAGVEDITVARYHGFVAFGTCSFTEPAHDAAHLIGA